MIKVLYVWPMALCANSVIDLTIAILHKKRKENKTENKIWILWRRHDFEHFDGKTNQRISNRNCEIPLSTRQNKRKRKFGHSRPICSLLLLLLLLRWLLWYCRRKWSLGCRKKECFFLHFFFSLLLNNVYLKVFVHTLGSSDSCA